MGILAWVVAGLVVAIVIQMLTRLAPREPWRPNVGIALLGSVLGGYFHDLILRGDSVMNFRGPTLIGASVGALLFLGISYWRPRATRSTR